MALSSRLQSGGGRGGRGGKSQLVRAPRRRRNGMPYERPALGRQASAGPQAGALSGASGGAAEGAKRNGWVGQRMLGSASRIVTTSASYLYSSIFKRPADGGMALLSEVEKPAVDSIEIQTDMLSASDAEAEYMEARSQHSEEDEISEVECWMKRTFPREEADRLVESLRSYVKENGTAEEQVDNVNLEQKGTVLVNQVPALRSGPSNGLSDAHRWRQEAVNVAKAYMREEVTEVDTPARVTLTTVSQEKKPIISCTNAPSSSIGCTLPVPGDLEGSRKRGSAVLEDGWYSFGGPIRRLRPRSSLRIPSPAASGLKRRGGLGTYPPPQRILRSTTQVKQKPITMWSRNVNTKEEARGSTIRKYASSSERASATFRKILEALDRMTPSPNEKFLDTELALVRESPTTELIASMVNDKACQTMQSWDYPGPQDLEAAGPSGWGRNLENNLLSAAGFSWIGTEQSTKARDKGKAPASTPSHALEEKDEDNPPFSFQDTARLKVPESCLANPSPAAGSNKGFQINTDVDDIDEQSVGAGATTSVTNRTSFLTEKNAPSGAGFFHNNPPKSLNITAPMFGAPVAADSQRTTSETSLIYGKSTVASGGFTFPSSNPFGTSVEPPPTPKPFPSPTDTSLAVNGLPTYKLNTGAAVDCMFKLPSACTGIADNVHSGEMKSNHKLDSKPDSSPSEVSAPETSQPFSTNPAQSTGAEISTPPSTTATFKSATFSLANTGATGASAKPVFAGIFNSQTSTPIPGSSSAQVTTLASNSETSIINFGKMPSSSPSSEPASLPPAATGDGPGLFRSNAMASSAASLASSAFGSSSSSSASSDDGEEQISTHDASGAGEDSFMPMTSNLHYPALDASNCARARVVLAYEILDILYAFLQWPSRAQLITQYEVNIDRSREHAVQDLLAIVADDNFIDLVVDSFFFVFLDLVESEPSNYLAFGLENLLAGFLSTPHGAAYVLSLPTSHQIRLGAIFFQSVWRQLSDS